jgi:hypothetical protein
MTTNALCITDHAATDSRWTLENKNGILYVDNTGFEKIILLGKVAFIFAGSAKLISFLKDFLNNLHRGQEPENADLQSVKRDEFFENVAFASINFTKGEFSTSNHRFSVCGKDYYFVGTGGIIAKSCWDINKDILRSVETAKNTDDYSGGNTIFVKHDLKNNINEQLGGGLEILSNSLKNKENVMIRSNGGSVSIQDMMDSGQDVSGILGLLKSENMVAPFSGMGDRLNEEERRYAFDSLKKAMSWVREDK